MRQSYEDIAQRMANAEAAFVETLMRCGGIDETAARRVLLLYAKERITTLDPNIGRVQVKHGAFLDRDVVRHAAGLEDGS